MYLHFQDIEKEIRILVNVTFSYAIIEEAAKDVQGRDHWRMNQKIADLQFSHKWSKLGALLTSYHMLMINTTLID